MQAPYGYARRDLGRLTVPSAVPSPELQRVGWVPTSDAEVESWAVELSLAWHSPEMQRRIRSVEERAQRDLSFNPQLAPPMDEEESYAWAFDYVRRTGFPKSASDGDRMLRAYLEQQGATMGVHPALVVSAELLTDFPDTPGEAADWTARVAVAFANGYGIALTTETDAKGIFTASASAAAMQAGIPVAGAIGLSVDSLWDGTLTVSEMRAIVGSVGGVVGAAVGQMFGVPAPIGAFIGSVVTELVFDGLSVAFGWGPTAADRRREAMVAAERARKALMKACLELAVGAWADYQKYWFAAVGGLQQSLDDNREWLESAGGLRYFGDVSLDRVESDSASCAAARAAFEGISRIFGGAATTTCTVPLPRPIDVHCDRLAGCPYWSGARSRGSIWTRSGVTTAEGVWVMSDIPSLAMMPLDQGALFSGRLDARSALAFYGASEFVTPYHAVRDALGEPGPLDILNVQKDRWGGIYPNWGATLHTDMDYLEAIAYIRMADSPEELGECQAVTWARGLIGSLTQVGPATALVMRDVSATVTAAIAEYKVAQELRRYGADAAAARTAATRRDLIRLRRQLDRRDAIVNGSLAAAGGGALAAWALSSVMK